MRYALHPTLALKASVRRGSGKSASLIVAIEKKLAALYIKDENHDEFSSGTGKRTTILSTRIATLRRTFPRATGRRRHRQSAIRGRRHVSPGAWEPASRVGHEFDCASWAQLFLKHILAEAAITCVIPATGKPAHMKDDLGAGFGRLPDACQHQQIRRLWAAL
jgi:hypothetical protein